MHPESIRAPATEAADVSIAEYDSIHFPGTGWIRIRQFRRDPQGAFFVSGFDSEGNWTENIPLPPGVPFRVRSTFRPVVIPSVGFPGHRWISRRMRKQLAVRPAR